MKSGPSLCLIVFALGMAVSIPVSAQSAKVAVVGDPALANLVDVTLSELSKQPDLSVLDRTDLDKLGHEQEIQAALGSQNLNGLQVLPADGLVLLHAATKDGKTGVFARLVAVQPGVVLREFALPGGTDPMTQAQALENDFAPYWPKLAALQKGRITALSLLGLRFEVDDLKTRDLERRINMLLASRLSAEPNVIVLERWRLNDAVFEKTLSPQQPSAFWTGSSLIDGGLRLENGLVYASLRLRPPQAPEVAVTDQDTIDNLPALAGRLADKIQSQPTSAATWSPSAEATHYAELGKWCADNHLFAEGTEALESAIALGDASRRTRLLLIKTYAREAFPDPLENLQYIGPWLGDITLDSIPPQSVPQRVAAALQSARLAQDYMKDTPDFTQQMRIDAVNGNPDCPEYRRGFVRNEPKDYGVDQVPWIVLEDPRDLSLAILNMCLRTLLVANLNGYDLTDPDAVADLRHETQQLMTAIEGRLASQSSAFPRHAYLCLQADYAGLWHENPEDTLDFYRKILHDGDSDGIWIRSVLFQNVRAPYLDNEGMAYYEMQKGAPWIVARDGRSPDEIEALWKKFIEELATSPDSMLQFDAIKFEFYSMRSNAGYDEVLPKYVAFLKLHSDILSTPRGDEFLIGLSDALSYGGMPQNEADRQDLINLYITLFKQHVHLPSTLESNLYQIGTCSKDPPGMDQNLQAAQADYDQWFQTQAAPDKKTPTAAAEEQEKPSPVASSTVDSLPVTQFVKIPLSEGTLQAEGSLIWYLNMASPHIVCGLNVTTRQTVFSYPIPKALDASNPLINDNAHSCHFLAVSPQWLAVGMDGQVLLGSRSDNQWRALDLPRSHYKPQWIDQQLYLLYDAFHGYELITPWSEEERTVGSGLIHVSLPEGASENLISSRRIPPKNSLDGQPLGTPQVLWKMVSGLQVVFSTGPICTSPQGKTDWSPWPGATPPHLVRPITGGALIESGYTFGGAPGQARAVWDSVVV